LSRIGKAGLLIVFAAPVVVSCQLLLDLHRLEPDPDAVLIDAASPPDPCAHAYPPPEPAVDDDPTTAEDYWFATERINLPLKEVNGFKPGLDLDDSCTCQPDLHDGAAPCETPGTDRISCDFDGGVDDAFGAAATQYTAFLRDYDVAGSINQKITTGDRTFLFFLSGYNGKANDREVGVALVTAGGLYDGATCDDPEAPLPAAPRETLLHPPRWDGCDRWSPLPGRLFGAFPKRKTQTFAAYVSNFTIVAHAQSFGFESLGEGVTVTHGAAVATITPADGGKDMEVSGFIAGRFAFSDAASLVGRTEVSADGGRTPLCATGLWPIASASLCASRDTMQQSSQEFRGATCDAVTTAIGFVARRAQVSNDEYQPPPHTVDCDAAIECQ
jgi:hypothetical protein